jgi:PAS domain S-box-containing protein
MNTLPLDLPGALLDDRAQLQFLATAGVQLSASLEPEAIFSLLARLPVPLLADFAGVAAFEPADRFVSIAVVHRDLQKEFLLRAIAQRWPFLVAHSAFSEAMVQAGAPVLLSLATDVELTALAVDAEHTRLLEVLAVHTLMIAPLVARGRAIGALVLGLSDATRHYGESDLVLAQELAQRGALALANASLYAQARGAEAALLAANAELEARVAARTADVRLTTARLRAAIEGNLDAVYFLQPLHDAQGQVIDFVFADINERAVQALGMRREQVIGQPLCELLPINRSAGFFDKYLAVYQTGVALEEEFHLDTREFPNTWLHHQVVPLADGVVISSRDVTESLRARERLRESEARFRSAFDHAVIGVALVGVDGAWLEVNQTLCAMLGYSAAALRERSEAAVTHPADRAFDGQQFARLCIGEAASVQYEKRYLHRDGRIVWAQLSAACVVDPAGLPRYYVVQVMDVTERHAAEQALRELNTRLAQSNRELQEFASVASHDLQEPLRKIQAFGDRLRSRYGAVLGDDGRDYLERMLQAAQRLQRLISDLLAFAQVSSRGLPFEQVNLNTLLQEVVSDLESQIERTGGVIRIGALPTLIADPTQMRQLFQNLISNALKFHRPDVAPVVQIDAQPVGPAPNPAEYQIRVTDNGIGFDEKYLDRVFTIFQRLHARSAYEGTGIGLAICRRIAERHNGALTARSTPGSGTTFFVTLPATQNGTLFEP